MNGFDQAPDNTRRTRQLSPDANGPIHPKSAPPDEEIRRLRLELQRLRDQQIALQRTPLPNETPRGR